MTVKMLPPGPLQTERLPDGRRRLLRDLNLEIGGEPLCVPKGFVTDYSSWPRCLPGPRFSRIDVAGVVHDALFWWGRWGAEPDARPVSFVEANRTWHKVARAGQEESRAGWLSAWSGRIGLFLGSWPVWIKYRRQDG